MNGQLHMWDVWFTAVQLTMFALSRRQHSVCFFVILKVKKEPLVHDTFCTINRVLTQFPGLDTFLKNAGNEVFDAQTSTIPYGSAPNVQKKLTPKPGSTGGCILLSFYSEVSESFSIS